MAGLFAGIIGSTAGLASIVSFPVLLLLGLPPVTANVTNTVALIGSSIGSVSGSRVELRGQGRDIRRWVPLAVIGGASGAALLLVLPSRYFAAVVPFLVAGASVLLLASPKLRELRTRRAEDPADAAAGPPRHGPMLAVGMLLTCVYGGYFGAAAGVMLLALLLATTDKPLPVANAVKNLLLGAANAVAALGFALFADVRWAAAIPLGLGCIVGGWFGPAIVRRVPARVMRTVIAAGGFALAIRLWIG